MSGKEECSSPLASVLANEPRDVRRTVEVLGRILTDTVSSRLTFDGFLYSSLGRFDSEVVCESRWLSSIGHITAGLALATLIDKFDPPVGPGSEYDPPTWGSVEIGEERLAPPAMLALRRGILLAGPPGVGKSVISRVLARELLGPFTVIIVDARAGQSALSDVYREARSLGPTIVIIEDIDLIVDSRRNRYGAPSVLSEFLAVMDADPMAPLLTVASTNDVSTLDAAAIRSARFDSIIEIGYPSRAAAARILSTYLHNVPGADGVQPDFVAAHFGPDTSGADIREIVRRTVLSGSGTVCTADLITTVKAGRFKPQLPDGNYL